MALRYDDNVSVFSPGPFSEVDVVTKMVDMVTNSAQTWTPTHYALNYSWENPVYHTCKLYVDRHNIIITQ